LIDTPSAAFGQADAGGIHDLAGMIVMDKTDSACLNVVAMLPV